MAHNTSSKCTDVRIGDTALFYKALSRKSAKRWRGPAKILEIGQTGATEKFQSQTFMVARYRVQTKVEEKDAGGAELDPARAQMRPREVAPWGYDGPGHEDDEMDVDEDKGATATSKGKPAGCSTATQRALPVSDAPPLSEQVPPSPRSSPKHPAYETAFDRICEQSKAAEVGRTLYDKVTWGQLHEQCS